MSDNFEELAGIFGENETYEIISITDDNGVKKDFFVVDGIAVDGIQYILVVDSDEFEQEEAEAYLLKEIEEDGDDVIYEPVQDEEEYNKVIILLQDENNSYEMKL